LVQARRRLADVIRSVTWEPLGVDSERLYPDAAGVGLGVPLQAELDRIGSQLRLGSELMPFASDVSRGNRSAQVMAAAKKRAFGVDLWAEGVQYLKGWTNELGDVASVFDAWLSDESPSGEEMEQRFEFLTLEQFARIYERGEAIEHMWRRLIKHGAMEPRLHPLILAAAEEPRLRQLWPFTSMWTLCFSRWVGGHSGDLPSADPCDNGFRVYAPSEFGRGRVLGEGDPADAVELLVSALPEPLEVLYRQPPSAP
jgi:hypothetical protein